MDSHELPNVAGRSCEWSLREFKRRCRIALRDEQETPLSDNALISILCNSVRLAREHEDVLRASEQDELAATPPSVEAAEICAEMAQVAATRLAQEVDGEDIPSLRSQFAAQMDALLEAERRIRAAARDAAPTPLEKDLGDEATGG